MSASIAVARTRGRIRRRLTVLAAAAALSVTGVALAVPAHADASVQITGSAASVQAGTGYTYTVSMPNGLEYLVGYSNSGVFDLTVNLTGAPATLTAETDNFGGTCTLSSAQASCAISWAALTGDPLVTFNVQPSAAGTVTAAASASTDGNFYGADSTTTTITSPAFPFTGFFAPVDNQPAVNEVHAGQSIPIQFSLGGDQGLNILAAGVPGRPAGQLHHRRTGQHRHRNRYRRRQRPAVQLFHRHLHLRVEDR